MANLCLENRNFGVKLPENIEILLKFALTHRKFFLTRSHDPQISNQIDATDSYHGDETVPTRTK